MSWKRTVIFLLILGILSSIYFIQIKPRSKKLNGAVARQTSASILELKNEEFVEQLSVEHVLNLGKFVFHKINKRWYISSPIQYPAEQVIVDGFVSLLKLTARFRNLMLEESHAGEFGFDRPLLTICLSTNLAETNRCLVVGKSSVIGKGFYARWTDEPTYFLVTEQFTNAFEKTLYSLRKKQVFSILEERIQSIQFLSDKKEIQIVQDGKNWYLKKPIEAAVGSQAMDQLLTKLNNVYVKEFLDEASSEDSKLGFSKSKNLIRIQFADGSVESLLQGAEAKGREACYAKSEDNHVWLVSSAKLSSLKEAFGGLIS